MSKNKIVHGILSGYHWIKNWEGEIARKLEALWIAEEAMVYASIIKKSSCTEARKNNILKNTFGDYVSSKYGGDLGSVIYTSEAAKIFNKTEQCKKYIRWLICQQNGDGSWSEKVTDGFPKDKSWYYLPNMKYWVTSTVLLNIYAVNYEMYSKNIKSAIKFIGAPIGDIYYKLCYTDDVYLKQLISFYELDLWTIAQVCKVFYSYNELAKFNECKLILMKLIKSNLKNENLDIQQNVMNAVMMFSQEENCPLVDSIVSNLLDMQNSDGSWGYSAGTSDITLSAYVIKNLAIYYEKYKKGHYIK